MRSWRTSRRTQRSKASAVPVHLPSSQREEEFLRVPWFREVRPSRLRNVEGENGPNGWKASGRLLDRYMSWRFEDGISIARRRVAISTAGWRPWDLSGLIVRAQGGLMWGLDIQRREGLAPIAHGRLPLDT